MYLLNKLDDPTSIVWMNSDNFINGYANVNILSKWNIETAKVTGTYKYTL